MSVKKRKKKNKKKNKKNFERKNSCRSPSYRISATKQDTTINCLMYKSMMQPSSKIVLQEDAWV